VVFADLPGSVPKFQLTMSNSDLQENSDVFQAKLAAAQPPRRSNRRAVLIIVVILGLMSAPMIFKWLPGEAARWRIAVAEEQRLDGDLPGAIRTLDAAIGEYPESAEIYLRRAAYHSEAKEYESAIQDLDQALVAGAAANVVLSERSQALHHLGKHAEAIEDCKELLRLSREERIGSPWEALNALAYARALGQVELKEGLENAEEAIRLAGPNLGILDTRGYLHYLLGEYESAADDLEQAVEQVEAYYARTPDAEYLPDRRLHESDQRRRNQMIAVLRYHRSLNYDKHGKHEKAKADRERVRELGFEPNASLF